MVWKTRISLLILVIANSFSQREIAKKKEKKRNETSIVICMWRLLRALRSSLMVVCHGEKNIYWQNCWFSSKLGEPSESADICQAGHFPTYCTLDLHYKTSVPWLASLEDQRLEDLRSVVLKLSLISEEHSLSYPAVRVSKYVVFSWLKLSYSGHWQKWPAYWKSSFFWSQIQLFHCTHTCVKKSPVCLDKLLQLKSWDLPFLQPAVYLEGPAPAVRDEQSFSDTAWAVVRC